MFPKAAQIALRVSAETARLETLRARIRSAQDPAVRLSLCGDRFLSASGHWRPSGVLALLWQHTPQAMRSADQRSPSPATSCSARRMTPSLQRAISHDGHVKMDTHFKFFVDW